ncbi:MAG: tetratricopeptide repeat protein [Bacteroidetes bacterium]|nr:tetratricopeptide repeat protein [Bacteroidota bacterium]
MRFLLLAFSIFLADLCFSQSSDEDSPNFLSERLYGYEDIDFVWKVEGKLQVFLNEGINYLKEGNLTAALANLNDFIKEDSTFWVARYYRGVTYKLLRKLKNAEADFSAVLARKKNSYETMLEMGKIYHFRNNARRAEKWYNQAIQLNPEKPLAYYMKGELELNQGNSRQAIKNYKISIERDPQFSDAKTKLALIEIIQKENIEAGLHYLDDILRKDSLNRIALLFRSSINYKKNPTASLKDLNTLVRINPENIEVRYSRGELLVGLEEFEAAFIDMRKVIQASREDENYFIGQQTTLDKRIDILNAGNYTTRTIFGFDEADTKKIKKGFCLLLVSKYDSSIREFDLVKNANKNSLTLFLKALANEHSGNHQEAFRLYNLALVFDNDITDAHKKRGIYLSELQNWSASEKDFSEVLKINPEIHVIYKLRGVTRYHQSNFSGAIDDFTQYINYLTRDSLELEQPLQFKIYQEVVGYRAMANQKDDHYLDAVYDFLVSDNMRAIDVTLMNNSITQLIIEGDTTKAMGYLNNYLRKTPYFAGAQISRIKILLLQKKWDQVETEIDQAIKIGASPYLHFVKGLVLKEKKNDAEAIKFFTDSIDLAKKLHEATAPPYLERGKLYAKLNKKKQAVKDFEAAKKLGSKEATRLLHELN